MPSIVENEKSLPCSRETTAACLLETPLSSATTEFDRSTSAGTQIPRTPSRDPQHRNSPSTLGNNIHIDSFGSVASDDELNTFAVSTTISANSDLKPNTLSIKKSKNPSNPFSPQPNPQVVDPLNIPQTDSLSRSPQSSNSGDFKSEKSAASGDLKYSKKSQAGGLTSVETESTADSESLTENSLLNRDCTRRQDINPKDDMHLLHTTNLRHNASFNSIDERRQALLTRSYSANRASTNSNDTFAKGRTSQSSPDFTITQFTQFNIPANVNVPTPIQEEACSSILREASVISGSPPTAILPSPVVGGAYSATSAVPYTQLAGIMGVVAGGATSSGANSVGNIEQQRDILLEEFESDDPANIGSATSLGTLSYNDCPPVSFGRLTVNMVLCGLGAGILSLPWTTAGAGCINAAVWNALVLCLCYYTMMMMVNSAEKFQVFDMEALLLRCNIFMKGTRWKLCCSLSIWLCYWIALVGYIIIISDSVTHIVKPSYPNFSRLIPVFFGSMIILPLCFLSQKTLALTSSVGVFSNCFVIFAIIYNYFYLGERADQICLLGFTEGNITYVSSICMAMVIQPCILPMYETMENRSPEGFSRILKLSFFILWTLFTGFSVFAYMSYGAKVEGNVLNNLPGHAWYSVVARGGMAFVCFGVYPLMVFPMVAPLKIQRKWKNLLILAIVVSTALGASVFDDLGQLNVICGALSTFFFIALFPVLIGMALLDRVPNWVLWGLFGVGSLSTVLGLIFSDNEADLLVQHCSWPIYIEKETNSWRTSSWILNSPADWLNSLFKFM